MNDKKLLCTALAIALGGAVSQSDILEAGGVALCDMENDAQIVCVEFINFDLIVL